jgi:FtsP/CotA-like multicopper oxidase with cupredoxin domain
MPQIVGRSNAYDISVRQFQQQVLPAPLGKTTVWGYGPTLEPNGIYNAPSLTIEAVRGTPITVTWRNELRADPLDPASPYLPHLLPVDPTLHWANPGQVGGSIDMRPDYTGKTYVPTLNAAQADGLDPATQYTRYWGPVPFVTHVHGMDSVEQWSDGYAEAWFLPQAGNLTGYTPFGTWYEYMKNQAALGGIDTATGWGPGKVTFQYPNTQRPGTVWYHDHAIGITRLNVYAGPAGFYLIRSSDPKDNPTVAGGAPAILPSGKYEVPMAIQDRSFNADGSLFYPDTRAFFDAFAGPFIGSLIPGTTTYSDVSPIYNPEFFGNCIMVNGNTWPFLAVEPRRYRLRLLNGCTARTLILKFSDPKVAVWQIGNEGGYLRNAIPLTEILLAPAERADLIVDFSRVKFGTNVTLQNTGPDAPFGGGGFRAADPQSTGLVMQFRISVPLAGADPTTLPAAMLMPADLPATPVFPPPAGTVTRTRPLALLELLATPPLAPVPVETNLGVITNPAAPRASIVAKKWDMPVSETPDVGDVEMWEFYNFTVDAHPIHIHEVFFQVVNRQRIDKVTGLPIQTPTPPNPWEDGFKDTVVCYPGEVTRVKLQAFPKAGRFAWHCHIVDHEDNEMMRPYRVGPDAGGPKP